MRVSVGAEVGEDEGAEFVEDGGVVRELVEGPAEQAGGGVAACDEDVHEIGAEVEWGGRFLDEGVEEAVFGGRGLGGGGPEEALLDEGVNEGVDRADVVLVVARVVQPVEVFEEVADADGDEASCVGFVEG